MKERDIISLYTVSPLHAGSGAIIGAVDLPIQRERHTGWPHVQASALKGAFRAHVRDGLEGADRKADEKLLNLIFGSDEQDGWKEMSVAKDGKGKMETLPAAIAVSDAKILAFPVRSNIAPFVWITCPAVLKRFGEDLEFSGAGKQEKVPAVKEESAVPLNGFKFDKEILLEDVVVKPEGSAEAGQVKACFPELERLLLVSDSVFDYCVSSCTEVQTQIKIDAQTGSTKDGSLRYQELLPSDTALYAVVLFNADNFDNSMQAAMVREQMKKRIGNYVQVGGDYTLGRGLCRAGWLSEKKQGGKS